ncbi:hypothetical protein BCR44DRAFT_1052121 [Catenaria anguillulae PL171]|uniref:REJ domain-containing protein n=1 Tax=Catenaria anguillulae PL171 TaxID=765915 RepID=A0A1Y2HR54_9FUNG|nr:hypothetical protein BCR44DRAFT_1052121 [Catenaria anguillulae PL171]
MAGQPPDAVPNEQQSVQPPVPDLNGLGTLIHDPHRQSILDTVQRLARPSVVSLASSNAETPSFSFPVSVPSRMSRDHVDSLLHTDYFVYERAVGVRLLMLIMRPEDGALGNQVFLVGPHCVPLIDAQPVLLSVHIPLNSIFACTD